MDDGGRGWHMYELTGSAWDLGLVGLYQFVPALLLALLAGHVVDRHHRGRIVAACFAVQALVALAAAGRRRRAPTRAGCCSACRWCWARCAPSRCRRSRR